MTAALASLEAGNGKRNELEAYVAHLFANEEKRLEDARKLFKCQLASLEARESRLVDVYLEGALDRETFEKRKGPLLFERRGIEEKLQNNSDPGERTEKVEKILELAFTALLSHERATDEEKREQLEMLTSNRTVEGKNVVVELSFPFSLFAYGEDFQSGAPDRNRSRRGRTLPPTASSLDNSLRHVVEELCDWLLANPNALTMLERENA